MWNELEYGGSYFGDVPAGGYRRLMDAMVSDVDVRLGRSVTEIEASAGRDAPVRWALGMLAEATGRPCPEPAAVAVTSWAADPWAGGAYTHIPPGASPADADGALTSGIREAKRLLGTPAVRLTVNHASKGA
jgi:hypothetical protein